MCGEACSCKKTVFMLIGPGYGNTSEDITPIMIATTKEQCSIQLEYEARRYKSSFSIYTMSVERRHYAPFGITPWARLPMAGKVVNHTTYILGTPDGRWNWDAMYQILELEL